MPIPVECSICGKKYRVPDEKAGRSIPCKDCGGEIDVPGGRRRATEDDDDDAPVRRKSAKKKKRSEESNSSGLLIAGGIGAAVLVVGIGLFFAMRGKPDAGNPIANNPVQPVTPPGTPDSGPGGSHAAPNPATPNPITPAPANPNPQPNVPANPNPQVAANPGINPPAANSPNTKAAGSGFKGGLDQGGVGGGFAMKPLVNWKAQPDPLETQVTYDTSKKFNVPIKGGFISDDSVVYPVTPSPFGLLGENDGKGGA